MAVLYIKEFPASALFLILSSLLGICSAIFLISHCDLSGSVLADLVHCRSL